MNDVLVAHIDESELDFVVQTLRQRVRLAEVGEHFEFGVAFGFQHKFALAIDPFRRFYVDRKRRPGEIIDRDQRVWLVLAEHQKSVWTFCGRKEMRLGQLVGS